MNTQHIDESSSTIQPNSRADLKKAFRVFAWLLITVILFALGLIVELGPKWPSGSINIPLSRGHGFTDQDAFALIPISLGIAWFAFGLWKFRTSLLDYIRREPEKSVMIIFTMGLILGLVVGTGFGAIFKADLRSVGRLF